MNQEEKALRSNIRRLIKHVKSKKLSENLKMKDLVGKLINHEIKQMILEASTPDVDPTPNKSTGINVLEELLKKIIPVLETDYKSLTTNSQQRESFRAHIINACVDTLTPAQANNDAADDEANSEQLQEIDLEIDEDVDVEIGSDSDNDKFIDIRSDAEKKAEEEEAEPDPRDKFGGNLSGDKTGRNMAYQSFKKIETSIIDSYELLGDPEDQELFYDYLIANLKLYFDKFEDQLAGDIEEPTNKAYDMAKKDAATQSDPANNQFDLEI